MMLAQKAIINNNLQSNLYQNLMGQAFNFEQEAAMLLLNDLTNEPTRSILFLSAASMAFNCLKIEEAEILISYAQMGNPDKYIKDQLDILYQEIQEYKVNN